MGRHEHSRYFHLFPDFLEKRHAKTKHAKSRQVMGSPAVSVEIPGKRGGGVAVLSKNK